MVATVSNHKIAFRVERNAAVATQLPRAAAFAANAADVGAITQPKYLNAAVAVPFMHDDVAVNVDGDAGGVGQLSLPTTLAADGADVRTVRVIQHLHAMITIINHNQMTGAIKRYTPKTVELAVACALLADGPQVLPIAVP